MVVDNPPGVALDVATSVAGDDGLDCRSREWKVACRELELMGVNEASEQVGMETGNCTVAGKDQDQVGYMACVPCVLVLGTGSNSIKK